MSRIGFAKLSVQRRKFIMLLGLNICTVMGLERYAVGKVFSCT